MLFILNFILIIIINRFHLIFKIVSVIGIQAQNSGCSADPAKYLEDWFNPVTD